MYRVYLEMLSHLKSVYHLNPVEIGVAIGVELGNKNNKVRSLRYRL